MKIIYSDGAEEKSCLNRVNKFYFQFGVVYERFIGETVPLDLSSKIIETHGFSLQNGFRGSNEHTLLHFAARVGRGMGPPISGDLETCFLTGLNKP